MTILTLVLTGPVWAWHPLLVGLNEEDCQSGYSCPGIIQGSSVK